MTVAYLVPPVAALFGAGAARVAGVGAWAMMALLFSRRCASTACSPLWGLALPAIAFAYLLFTLDSALQSMRGKGGLWKGRVPGSGREMTAAAAELRPPARATGTRISRSPRC